MNKYGKSAVSVARSSKIYSATDNTIMDIFSQFQLRQNYIAKLGSYRRESTFFA